MQNNALKWLQNKKFLIANLAILFPFLLSSSPARDDWNNLSDLRSIPFSFQGLYNVFTNTWCCMHEPRFFWISWFIQWPISRLSNFAPLALYLIIGLVLIGISFNTSKIMQRIGLDARWSNGIGYICAWSACVLVVSDWGNNLSFVLPFYFLTLLILELTKTEDVRLFKVLLTSLCAQFSGESTLGLLYLVVVAYLFHCLRVNKNKSQAIFLTLSNALASITYYLLLNVPKGIHFKLSWDVLPNYFGQLWDQEKNLWNYFGPLYKPKYLGYIFILTVVISLLNTLIILDFPTKKTGIHFVHKILNPTFWFVVIMIPIAIFFPMWLGIIDGSRLGPDYRYHLPLVLLLSVAFCLGIYKITNHNVGALLLILSVIAIGSASAISTSNTQHDLDDEIWHQISTTVQEKSITAIVTYNPSANYPMPAYYSFAPSDFQADWGISGKLNWMYRIHPKIFAKLDCSHNFCTGYGYYGDTSTFYYSTNKNIVYVMSHVSENTNHLSISDFTITNNYKTYLKYIATFK